MAEALDAARAAMLAAPEDDAARLAFFGAFAEAEIAVLLSEEPTDDEVRPATVDLGGAPHVLAFSDEARLADHAFDHARGPAAQASLPGRALAALLAGQGVGVALDLGADLVAVSPDDLAWLARTLGSLPESASGRPVSLAAPTLEDRAVAALARRLADAGGLAAEAWLVTARWADARQGPLLLIADAAAGAEQPLAAAAGEAVAFAGAGEAGLDVAFVRSGDPLLAEAAEVGKRLEMPAPPAPEPNATPGSDPARPPRLR